MDTPLLQGPLDITPSRFRAGDEAQALVRQVLRLSYMLGFDSHSYTRKLCQTLRVVTFRDSKPAYAQIHVALNRLADEILEVIDDWPADSAMPVIELCDDAEASVVRAWRSLKG